MLFMKSIDDITNELIDEINECAKKLKSVRNKNAKEGYKKEIRVNIHKEMQCIIKEVNENDCKEAFMRNFAHKFASSLTEIRADIELRSLRNVFRGMEKEISPCDFHSLWFLLLQFHYDSSKQKLCYWSDYNQYKYHYEEGELEVDLKTSIPALFFCTLMHPEVDSEKHSDFPTYKETFLAEEERLKSELSLEELQTWRYFHNEQMPTQKSGKRVMRYSELRETLHKSDIESMSSTSNDKEKSLTQTSSCTWEDVLKHAAKVPEFIPQQ